MTLTQKEQSYCNDFKAQEQLCIDKYTKYSSEACNSQLKNLFTQLAQAEQTHLDTINQILNGTQPSVSPAPSATGATCCDTTPYADDRSKQIDCLLCRDMLAMEKHVSAGYNTGIFEFTNPVLRDALAHIQKEEQNHGEQLYSYMSCHSMATC